MKKEELENTSIKTELKKAKAMFWALTILSLLLAGFMVRDLVRSGTFEIIMLMPVLTGITAVLEYVKIRKYKKELEPRNQT